ncbi:hypothetical protein ABK040_004278 [Willaertia magna]
MHKLLNQSESCVTENLNGLVMTFPTKLKQLKENNKLLNVIIQNNFDNTKQVAMLSGGGSGHSPAHEGFVFKGMLTGAVLGPVFTSPGIPLIIKAIHSITKPKNQGGKGCLLIVKNYTGDILNFKLAREIAIQEGYHVEMIIVGDDVTHQRGIAGTVLIHKLSGALAEQGKSLSEIVTTLQKINLMPTTVNLNNNSDINNSENNTTAAIVSIGIGLNSITIPGHDQKLYEMEENHYELGLGIHGEKGIERKPLPESNVANKLTKEMIEKLINYLPSSLTLLDSNTTNKKKKKHCVLMVNNLGSTTLLELNTIVKECICQLEEQDIVIERIIVGTLMTALEMHGVSLTLFYLGENNEEKDFWLNLLDMETDSPYFPKSILSSLISNHTNRNEQDVYSLIITRDNLYNNENKKTEITKEENKIFVGSLKNINDIVKDICNYLITRYKDYNELDAKVADGDIGDSIKRSCELILENVIDNYSIHSIPDFFYQIGLNVQQSGGSSGAILSMFFLKFSFALKEENEESSLFKKWMEAFNQGVLGMMELTDTKKGDRTLLDTVIPVMELFNNELIFEMKDRDELIKEIVKVANEGMLNTANWTAKKGRSRYLGERVLGIVDPGAFVIYEIIEFWSKLI